MTAIQLWAGQVTTGHGAMGLTGLLLACMSGQMTWATAAPLFAAAVVALLWPENKPAAAAAAQWMTGELKEMQPLLPAEADIEAAIKKVLKQMAAPKPLTPAASALASTSGVMSVRAALALGGLAALIAVSWMFRHALPVLCFVWALAIPLLLTSLMLAVHRRRLRHGGIGLFLLFAGCTAPQVQANLQANGVSAPVAAQVASVVSTAVDDGTLFCKIAGVTAAVPGVSVIDHGAAQINTACQQASIIGAVVSAVAPLAVPVAPPANPTVVPIAVVPPAAASAVAASVPAKS